MSAAASARRPLQPPDWQLQHIASTKAKLSEDDSIELFAAFLAGDVGDVLARIIERRVEEATEDLLEQKQAHFNERLEDMRTEFRRQLAAGGAGHLAARLADVLHEVSSELLGGTSLTQAEMGEGIGLHDAACALDVLLGRDLSRFRLGPNAAPRKYAAAAE